MYKSAVLKQLLIFVVIFSTSCTEEIWDLVLGEEEVSPQPQQVESQPVATQPSLVVEVPLSLDEIMSRSIGFPFKQKREGALLQIEIQNGRPYSDKEFDMMVMGLAQDLARTQQSFKVVTLKARGSEGTYFQSRFYLSDVKAYLNKQISQPELLRRFDIAKVETVESLARKSIDYRGEGQDELALKEIEKWLKLEPDQAQALELKANIFRDQKQYWQAIEIYQKIAESGNPQASVFHNLAFCYDQQGALDDAITHYKKALKIDADNILLMQQLIQVFRKKGDYNGGMVWMDKAQKIKQTSDLWMIKGNLHRMAKKYKLAGKAYLKGQKLSPPDHRFHFNLILLDLDTKRFRSAKKKYAELLTRDPVLAEELSHVEVFH